MKKRKGTRKWIKIEKVERRQKQKKGKRPLRVSRLTGRLDQSRPKSLDSARVSHPILSKTIAMWAVLPLQLISRVKHACWYMLRRFASATLALVQVLRCHAWLRLVQVATWAVLPPRLGSCCKSLCISCVCGYVARHSIKIKSERVNNPLVVLKCFPGK